MAVAVVTFLLAIASIANPDDHTLVQLMYAAFAGAIVGRIVAALHSARAEALREDSEGEK